MSFFHIVGNIFKIYISNLKKHFMTKKNNLLILLVSAFLFFGCHSDVWNDSDTELSKTEVKHQSFKFKDVPIFKNFVNKERIANKSEPGILSGITDDSDVLVITKEIRASYSTIVKHADKSFDVLVYSIDKENKESSFIAKYTPSSQDSYFYLDNFTGNIDYVSLDGTLLGTLQMNKGIPLPINKNSNNSKTVECHYDIAVTAVQCSAGGSHMPGDACDGKPNQQPYYDVSINYICKVVSASGPKQFPPMGGDYGSGSNPVYSLSNGEALNYMLSQIGLEGLSTPQFDFVEAHPALGNELKNWFFNHTNVTSADFLKVAINYLILHPNTTWPQLYSSFLSTPNEKIQEWFSNTAFRAKFDKLTVTSPPNNVFDLNHEMGAYMRYPTAGTNIPPAFVDIDLPPCATDGNLPNFEEGMGGLMHSHTNSTCSGGTPIKVPSPTDIQTFVNTLLRESMQFTGSYHNAYSLVATSGGNYMLMYNKTTPPGSINFSERKLLQTDYEKNFTLLYSNKEDVTQSDIEKIFTKFMKEQVNRLGIEIYRVTPSSIVKIEYDPTSPNSVKETTYP